MTVRVALINDYPVVVEGLASLLEPHVARVEVVELAVRRDPDRKVHIALYDTFSQPQVSSDTMDRLLADPDVDHVAIFTWNMQPALIDAAKQRGVRGFLSKSLTADQLVGALERIAEGEVVVAPDDQIGSADVPVTAGDWPGRRHGLSPRQAEVLALVTQGLSNEEISKRAFLSVNTVKSYLRQAYSTIGVHSRSQAILWGLDHGMGLQQAERHPHDA